MSEKHLEELSHLAEKMVAEMLEKGYVPAEITKLDTFQFSKDSILVFQLERKLPDDVRKRMIDNFDRWLLKKGMSGIYLPPDLNLVALLKAPETTPRDNVQIGEE